MRTSPRAEYGVLVDRNLDSREVEQQLEEIIQEQVSQFVNFT
jgi:hypothetical protein